MLAQNTMPRRREDVNRPQRVRRGFRRIAIVGAMLFLIPALWTVGASSIAYMSPVPQVGPWMDYDPQYSNLTTDQRQSILNAQHRRSYSEPIPWAVGFALSAVVVFGALVGVGWMITGFMDDSA